MDGYLEPGWVVIGLDDNEGPEDQAYQWNVHTEDPDSEDLAYLITLVLPVTSPIIVDTITPLISLALPKPKVGLGVSLRPHDPHAGIVTALGHLHGICRIHAETGSEDESDSEDSESEDEDREERPRTKFFGNEFIRLLGVPYEVDGQLIWPFPSLKHLSIPMRCNPSTILQTLGQRYGHGPQTSARPQELPPPLEGLTLKKCWRGWSEAVQEKVKTIVGEGCFELE